MNINRRDFLGAFVIASSNLPAAGARSGSRLGMVIHSYPNHLAADRERPAAERFDDAFRFLKHGENLGVGCVQVGLGRRAPEEAERLAEEARRANIALEGIVRLPQDEGDLARFEDEIVTAKRAGARVVRTVTLASRRYETFETRAAFERFRDRTVTALRLAEAVVSRHGVKLAVENHKDWRADELLALLKAHDPETIGVCLDTGNSIALLEDPIEVVEALAPRAWTTHFKDMGVAEYELGFRLAEVPLGSGFLDLPRIVRVLRKARPEIHFNLEMITRDPLAVPCLADPYWTTFPQLEGRHLARTLRMVREHASRAPLPRISDRDLAERLRIEDENVRACLGHARTALGLT